MIFEKGYEPKTIRDIPFGTLLFGGIALVLAIAGLIGVLLG